MRENDTQVVRPDPYWLFAAALVGADQLIKYMIGSLNRPVDLSWISIGRLVNSDGAFGLQFSNELLTLLAIAICIVILFLLLTSAHRPPTRLGLWLIFGGALSNLIDRVFTGGAVDILSVGGSPRFNLADVMIVLGALSLLRGIWWRELPPRHSISATKTTN
jgi:signal peptidase II